MCGRSLSVSLEKPVVYRLAGVDDYFSLSCLCVSERVVWERVLFLEEGRGGWRVCDGKGCAECGNACECE